MNLKQFNNLWKNQPCYIVGGGPSLINFDFKRLEGRNTIAINNSIFFVAADVFFAMDEHFIRLALSNYFGINNRLKLIQTKLKLYLNVAGRPLHCEEILEITSLGEQGLSRDIAQGLYHGLNSGFGAFNLAYAMGANPIYLLGIDFSYLTFGISHYHYGYPTTTPEEEVKRYAIAFHSVKDRIKKEGIKVYNCSVLSKDRVFEYKPLNEI